MKLDEPVPDIQLFVCCHQPSPVPEHPLLNPIQAGAALADAHFPGFLHDDTGENISQKNRSYCELTAQYWAWKNINADYYGFFHYRRYLYPDVNARRPYLIAQAPTLPLLEKLGYGRFGELIPQYDVILPKGEDMHLPAWKHYAQAPFHRGEDLELVQKILLERHPEFAGAAEEYLNGSLCYFGNIFIMGKEIFRDYCAWLFPMLAEFDARADTSGYSPQERRVDGYLAERLLGIYAAWLCRAGGVRMLELPRVHFVPDGKERRNMRLLNILLPPGGRWRALGKRVGQIAYKNRLHQH